MADLYTVKVSCGDIMMISHKLAVVEIELLNMFKKACTVTYQCY